MAPKTINYDNTHFYKICCKDINIKDLYIGHTTDFIRRRAAHKSLYNNENNRLYNMPLYYFIRNNGGWDNFDMILIECCKCENFLDACKKEREYIEKLGATLNKVIPTRTKQEYIETNKDIIKMKQQQYRDRTKEQRKQYYCKHKENIIQKTKEYYQTNKDKKKEYREQRKDIMKDYQREYYQNNKDKKKEYRQAKKAILEAQIELCKLKIVMLDELD